MNWRIKCVAFHLLNRLPFGRSFHAAFQKHATGRYFQRITPATLESLQYHLTQFAKLPNGAVALEFGTGRSLLTPLLLSNAGASRVYAFDLHRLATVDQVNNVIEQLGDLVPGEWPTVRSLEDLWETYRIDYRAPADARSTGLAPRSVDFFCSTATLEHIPEGDIKAILSECLRIATPQALFSFTIDYHDHYGTADSNITRWNFYKYSDREWRKYNPGNHYVNRLRHVDHQRIFSEIGLDRLLDDRIIPEWAHKELERVSVCGKFSHYSREDLVTSNGMFLLTAADKLSPWDRMGNSEGAQ